VVGLDETPDAFRRLQTDKSQIKIMVAPGSSPLHPFGVPLPQRGRRGARLTSLPLWGSTAEGREGGYGLRSLVSPSWAVLATSLPSML